MHGPFLIRSLRALCLAGSAIGTNLGVQAGDHGGASAQSGVDGAEECCSLAGTRSTLTQGVQQMTAVVDSQGHLHLLLLSGDHRHADVQAQIVARPGHRGGAGGIDSAGMTELMPAEPLLAGMPTTSVSAAANGRGQVMATWHRNGVIRAALYTPGLDGGAAGAWRLLAATVNMLDSNLATDPAVASVTDTGFEIVWRERTAAPTGYAVLGRRYTIDTDAWGARTLIASSPSETGAPRIASDAAGNLLVAWHAAGAGVVFNRRSAGAGWSAAGVPVGSGLALETLRVAASGKAVLLTSDRRGTVHAARLDIGASAPLLGAAQVVASSHGSAPDADIDDRGRITIFGVNGVASHSPASTLLRWTYVPGAGWSAAQAIGATVDGAITTTALGTVALRVAGTDADGRLVLTWLHREGARADASSHVMVLRFDASPNPSLHASQVDAAGPPTAATTGLTTRHSTAAVGGAVVTPVVASGRLPARVR